MNQQDLNERLQEKIDLLPRQIKAQRDLWPGIDLALEEQLQSTQVTRRWYAIAASVALFGLISLMSLNTTHEPETVSPDFGQIISQLSQQHEQQKQILLSTYDQQPALTDNWQSQLEELDSAASTIRTALEQDPTDLNLIDMLQQVYQQQIRIIQSVHQSRWM